MKRRVRRILNFFAFNLLFFALYLNFIHKDKVATTEQTVQQSAPAFNGTVLVNNPEKYLDKKNEINSPVTAQQITPAKSEQSGAQN